MTDTDIRPPGPRRIQILADTSYWQISGYRPVSGYPADIRISADIRMPTSIQISADIRIPDSGSLVPPSGWCCLEKPPRNTKLHMAMFQYKPRMSLHQREGEDTWTGPLSLTCCLDTLEQDTKGTGKKNVIFQILIFNFLLRTWSTHEYSES